MHAIGLGGTKQITLKVLEDLQPAKRTLIDQLLVKIRPISRMYRTPDALANKSTWNGSDWLYWLLFYAIPCLTDLVDNDCLTIFFTLNHIMNIALSDEISYAQIIECEKESFDFNRRCQNDSFLGKGRMTSNIHSVLHISDSVLKNGPLWATSDFVFESKIAKLKESIAGPKSVPDQIADRIGEYYEFRNRLIMKYIDKVEPCARFCKTMFYRNPPPTFNFINTQEGPILYTDHCSRLQSFSRCSYKDVIYCSQEYELAKKTDDTVVLLENGDMGIINFFHVENDRVLANIEPLKVKAVECSGMISNNIFKVIERIKDTDVSFMSIKKKLVHVFLSQTREYVILPPPFFDVK